MIEALFVFFVDRVQVLAASEMPGPGDSGPRATSVVGFSSEIRKCFVLCVILYWRIIMYNVYIQVTNILNPTFVLHFLEVIFLISISKLKMVKWFVSVAFRSFLFINRPVGLSSIASSKRDHLKIARLPRRACQFFQLVVNCWFGARWFGIRIGVPLSNSPFHKGILGIQTTGPQTTN